MNSCNCFTWMGLYHFDYNLYGIFYLLRQKMHPHVQIFYTNTSVNNMHKLHANCVLGELLQAKCYVKNIYSSFFFLLKFWCWFGGLLFSCLFFIEGLVSQPEVGLDLSALPPPPPGIVGIYHQDQISFHSCLFSSFLFFFFSLLLWKVRKFIRDQGRLFYSSQEIGSRRKESRFCIFFSLMHLPVWFRNVNDCGTLHGKTVG